MLSERLLTAGNFSISPFFLKKIEASSDDLTLANRTLTNAYSESSQTANVASPLLEGPKGLQQRCSVKVLQLDEAITYHYASHRTNIKPNLTANTHKPHRFPASRARFLPLHGRKPRSTPRAYRSHQPGAAESPAPGKRQQQTRQLSSKGLSTGAVARPSAVSGEREAHPENHSSSLQRLPCPFFAEG